MKLTDPEGLKIDDDYLLTKIVGLSFSISDFKEIICLFDKRIKKKVKEGELAPLLFSENVWAVDSEGRHHVLVGYIIRNIKTLILIYFWLSQEGMYDIINNSPIGLIIYPIPKNNNFEQAFDKLYKILQFGINRYRLIIADLEPFKDHDPTKI